MEKYFSVFVFGASLLLFGANSLLIFINDTYGLKSLDSARAEFIISSAQEVYPPRIYARAPNYLLGTSRTMRINLYHLEKYLNNHVIFAGLSAANIKEMNFLLKEIKQNNKRVVLGFDAWMININNQYYGQERISASFSNSKIKNKARFYLSFWVLKDSVRAILKNILKIPKDKKYSIFDTEILKEAFDLNTIEYKSFTSNPLKSAHFRDYKINDEDVLFLANHLDSKDIVIVFPKYFAYYKLFQKYDDIEAKYFGALKTLRAKTDAQIWSFYGINELTLESQNYDEDGWHFRPFIGDKIMEQIFEGKDYGGVELTKENIDEELEKISKKIREYEVN